MKTAMTVILLVFVAASIVYMTIGERDTSAETPAFTGTSTPSTAKGTDARSDRAVAQLEATHRVDGKPAAATASPESVPDSKEAAAGKRNVIAYYFHRTQRCHTCLTMEAYARAALDEGFTDELESDGLQFRSVNVDEKANEHFVNEYDLYASALVLVDMEGHEVKRSKKLEQIWDLVGDELNFKTFVRDETMAYLEDAP